MDAHLLSNEKDLLQIHGFNFILLYVAVFFNTKKSILDIYFSKVWKSHCFEIFENFIYNWN